MLANKRILSGFFPCQTYLMPGEEFIRQGDIGRELGFVAAGVVDLMTEDAGGLVSRSVHGNNLDMPTIVGEISFFLSTTQPFKVFAAPLCTGPRRCLYCSKSWGFHTANPGVYP